MKGLFTVAALLFFFSSCKENGVQLSKPSTFVKYFNDGNQNQAIDVLETSDKGYLILAHSQASNGYGSINVIKTDFNGNTLWEKSYKKDTSDLIPSNFVAVKDNSGNDQGYVIVGTVKNFNKYSKFGARLYILKITNAGDTTASRSYYTTNFGNGVSYRQGSGQYVIGKGVAQSTNTPNDIFVVGQVVQSDLVTPVLPVDGKGGDMYFAQINGATLDTVFTRVYGAGTSSLANRLYLDYTQTSAYWGGSRTDDQGTHMRLVNAGFNSQNTNFDLPYPTGMTGYNGNDFTPYGYGFTIVGNNTSGSEIDVISVGSTGKDSPPISLPTDKSGVIKVTGNSVCATLDGGLLVLGTTAIDAQGTNTDYYLIKLDATGTESWEKTHGGKYLDAGSRVLQSSDGGYIVLGTTTLANVKTVFFMKTDTQGNIE